MIREFSQEVVRLDGKEKTPLGLAIHHSLTAISGKAMKFDYMLHEDDLGKMHVDRNPAYLWTEKISCDLEELIAFALSFVDKCSDFVG
ncbi:hypothetical protein VNO77_27565 [Canavalia gladiata]|uniref:Uncharacterized protein n=1 Tax=Canavalia gladiata TaxID=3824 RepID=A0AAN9Q6L6_CANGL